MLKLCTCTAMNWRILIGVHVQSVNTFYLLLAEIFLILWISFSLIIVSKWYHTLLICIRYLKNMNISGTGWGIEKTQDAILSHFENTFRKDQNWIDDFFIVVAWQNNCSQYCFQGAAKYFCCFCELVNFCSCLAVCYLFVCSMPIQLFTDQFCNPIRIGNGGGRGIIFKPEPDLKLTVHSRLYSSPSPPHRHFQCLRYLRIVKYC